MTQLTLTNATATDAPTTDADDRSAIIAASHELRAAFAAHISIPSASRDLEAHDVSSAIAELCIVLPTRCFTASLRSAMNQLDLHVHNHDHARAGKALRHLGVCLRHSLSLL